MESQSNLTIVEFESTQDDIFWISSADLVSLKDSLAEPGEWENDH